VAAGVVIAVALLVAGPPVLEAGEAVARRPEAAPGVGLDRGRLAVDLHDADLEAVLEEIAARGEFRLTTLGPLGRVTASFGGVSLEDGLRRLTGEHELVLVYQAAEGRRRDPILVEVRVFAGGQSSDPARRAAGVAEIDRLLRAGRPADSAPRLAVLVGTAADSSVRSRAVLALSQIGGPVAEGPLTGALSDAAPDVRLQAVDGLRRVSGLRAIPAIQAVLLNDTHAGVRRAAARALGMLRQASATSALNAAVQDPDPSVRREVARALRRHGVVVTP
jgi:hypothetical protein